MIWIIYIFSWNSRSRYFGTRWSANEESPGNSQLYIKRRSARLSRSDDNYKAACICCFSYRLIIGSYRAISAHLLNAVEAHLPDGTTQIIFQTTPPGFPTEDAMRAMMFWYDTDIETHPLVKSALFCYEFVSIHPFQDGNGRLSRLLATLLLRKSGYQRIRYVSFEHETGYTWCRTGHFS